jgi:hypothetical protein
MTASCASPSTVRFMAVRPDGGASVHEYPLALAEAVAETMRAAGLRIAWYSVEAPSTPQPTRPTRREHRADRQTAAAMGRL